MLSKTPPKRPPTRAVTLEEAPVQLYALKLLGAFLDAKRRPPTFRELAIAMEGSQSAARQVIARLERRGFVARSGETRYCDISITPEGRARLNEIKRAKNPRKAKAA